jgi:hypothetical protein
MVDRRVFRQLEPPPSRGYSAVLDLPLNADPKAARSAAYGWADDVWTAWPAHHPTVREWVDRSGLGANH